MSIFGKLFSSGNKNKAESTQEAIQRLRGIEEMLTKKSEFLEKKITIELTTAKKHGTKDKRVALQALKRKKRFEKQLQQIDGTLTTIEYQREALENASTNTEVLKAMGSAAKTLKESQNNLNVEKVHDLMDEVAEQQEVANEITEAISNPVGFNQDVDEDDLLAELEEMEEEEVKSQLLDIGGTSTLPSLPEPSNIEPRIGKTVEDEEMLELAAWAS